MRKKKEPKKRARNDTSSKKRKVAKKKARKEVIPKTRNSNTMTEQAFWNMIRALLRKRSVYWLPIIQTRYDAQVPYTGPNKRRKFSYVCERCKQEFAGNEVSVHHINEVGSLTKAEDLPGFVERLFCEKDGLLLVCNTCHLEIHSKKE